MIKLHVAKRAAIAIAVAGCLLGTAEIAKAAESGFAFDFESFPPGVTQPHVNFAPLNVQYASQNLVFPVPSSGTDAPVLDAQSVEPHSGDFVAGGQNYFHEFSGTPFDWEFRAGQTYVQFWAGSDCAGPGQFAQVTGFDAGGNVISVAGPTPITGRSAATPIAIAAPTPNIFKVRYEIVNSAGQNMLCHGAIDDLIIQGNAPPSAGAPPSITLILPQETAIRDYAVSDLIAFGTYSGTNLVPVMEFELTRIDTPGASGFEIQQIPKPLDPNQTTGTDIQFTIVVKQQGTMPMSRYTLVATIRDFAGQEAHATVNFSNFPDVLVNPTPPPLGPFLYGAIADGCQMAFYFGGAMAYVPNTVPIFVPRPIAEKWAVVDSPMLGPKHTLGCPTRVATDGSLVGWQAQNFARGRIYSPTGGTAVYVPKILTDAFPKISHHVASDPQEAQIAADFKYIGWPVRDPDSILDVDNPTWVFQRFAQNTLGDAYHNTLEVRGRTPQLFVERVGGDPDERSLAQATDQVPHPVPRVETSTPTIWETYPCQKVNGEMWPSTCDLSARLDADALDALANIDGPVACAQEPNCSCEGPDNKCDLPTLHIQAGVYKPWWGTTAFGVTGNYEGIIRDFDQNGPDPGSHLAYYDYPFNHDTCNTTLGRDLELAGDIAVTAVSCVANLIAPFADFCDDAVSNIKGSDFCKSDWNLHTRPLPAASNYKFLSQGNINSRHDFEIEFEATYAVNDGYFNNFKPLVGDLVSIHGRSIADCGHCPYFAEFHPPDVVVTSRSRVQNFGNAPSRRITSAFVWANAFLDATDGVNTFPVDPVKMPVYAPPRTSARARLIPTNHETPYFKAERVTFDRKTTTSGSEYTVQANPTGAQFANHNGGQWSLPGTGARFVDYLEMFWADPL